MDCDDTPLITVLSPATSAAAGAEPGDAAALSPALAVAIFGSRAVLDSKQARGDRRPLSDEGARAKNWLLQCLKTRPAYAQSCFRSVVKHYRIDEAERERISRLVASERDTLETGKSRKYMYRQANGRFMLVTPRKEATSHGPIRQRDRFRVPNISFDPEKQGLLLKELNSPDLSIEAGAGKKR